MFKEYEEKYEKVFTNYEKKRKKFNIDDVHPYNNIPLNNSLYIKLFRDEMMKFESDLFDHLVKVTWLMRRFCYKGNRRTKFGTNGFDMDASYSIFMRRFVGFDTKFMLSHKSILTKVMTYFDDFFSNFDDGNPFEEKYEFPYKNLTLNHLVLVYQMEYRLDLLKIANMRKLSYQEFLDYVINYINCYNDELGKNQYEFFFSNKFVLYIKKMF